MKQYSFANTAVVDLESVVAILPVRYISPSLNENSNYRYGEFCFEIIMKLCPIKVNIYHEDRDTLIMWREEFCVKIKDYMERGISC